MQEGQEFSTKKECREARRMPKHCIRSALWAPACVPFYYLRPALGWGRGGVGFRFKVEGVSVRISGKVQKKDLVSPVLACSQPNVVHVIYF